MKIKLVITSLLIALSCSAQRSPFYFRFGGSLFLSDDKGYENKVVVIPALTFSPGLNFIRGKDFALSLTAPVSIGASSRTDTYFGFDFPAMLEAHFGSATGNQDKISLGGMLGGGVAYTYSENYYDIFNSSKVSFGGYRFHGGISFGKSKDGDRGLILLSYGRGLRDTQKEIYGISIHMIMGFMNK
jgi:hypothetical protein